MPTFSVICTCGKTGRKSFSGKSWVLKQGTNPEPEIESSGTNNQFWPNLFRNKKKQNQPISVAN